MNDIFENTETMKENEHPRFYTAESVMRGHPDSRSLPSGIAPPLPNPKTWEQDHDVEHYPNH